MDLLEQLEKEHQSNLDFFEQVEEKYRSNVGLFERDEDVHRSSMNNIRRLEEECYDCKKQLNMVLFRQAEKEYLEYVKQQSGAQACEQQADTEVPNQQFCFEGRKHQFININGIRTCNDCGLVSGPVFVPGYNCWDRAAMRGPDKSSVSHRYENFCRRRNITDFVLSEGDKFEIIKNIEEVYNAEEPKGSRLPNLNILTYQMCKRLNIEIDETLLNLRFRKVRLLMIGVGRYFRH